MNKIELVAQGAEVRINKAEGKKHVDKWKIATSRKVKKAIIRYIKRRENIHR